MLKGSYFGDGVILYQDIFSLNLGSVIWSEMMSPALSHFQDVGTHHPS